ncbi:peptidase [Streptomyces meridianus]|uniref:Peptidase n=1 Tax=Streptomyces meridianus TaxID=2938945 RepID=A0ABT0WZW4_9ACTN|nr:peptidase [Streptomyces meridianus]MCM2575871.1 peptidase [Streptomyces meridianus]
MRLRNALAASAVAVVTAAVIAPLGAQPGSAAPAPDPAPGDTAIAGPGADDPAGPPENQPPEPYCGDPESEDFPIETRVRPGAKDYEPGGGGHTWKLDLRNTTKAACRSIHPVAVLVDRERKLKPGQVRLEYAAPGRRGWHPVELERTEHDETVGVFDTADRQGFAVGRGRTLTLRVRMRFAPDAADNRVELKVAAVQRRDDDGDWVGRSNGYSFRIGTGGRAEPADEPSAGAATGDEPAPARTGTGPRTGASRSPGADPGASRTGEPQPPRTGGAAESRRPSDGTGPSKDGTADPAAPPRASRPPELAETGPNPATAAAGLSTAAALVGLGGLLVRRSRRLGR